MKLEDDSYYSNDYWLTVRDFITPDTLYLGNLSTGAPEPLKSLPGFFDATGLEVNQHFATSKDGTKCPTEVSNPSNKNRPTLLYGYGGFGIMLPYYCFCWNGMVGKRWYLCGCQHPRGGSGPTWHQAP